MSIVAYAAAAPVQGNAHLAVAYLPFVQRVAKRLARRLPAFITLDDLVGAGVIGLLEALERFDSTQDTTFEKYAEFRVRGAMLDELRRRDIMAKHARRDSKKLQDSVTELAQRLGREPEEEELAKHLDMNLQGLRDTLQKLIPVQVVSMEDVPISVLPQATENPFQQVARKETLTQLTAAITHLTQRQQQVLALYYQESLTLNDIAQVLGVTESRVSQILSETTARLRSLMRRGVTPKDLDEASER